MSKARAARQAASPPARPGVIGAAAAGLALGLFVSFRYAISIWTPDSDMAVPLALWTGFQRHGWSFLASWRYTPDNWLLSLTPIDALVFSLAGPSPTTVAAVGWMIFAASVALTAALAWRLAGATAAAVLACVLAFANPAAIGSAGYLAYPVTHNISMAWALAALILGAAAVGRGSVLLALASGLAVFIDAVSDPWAMPAIALPLILASGVFALARRREAAGRGAAALFVACGLAAWAAQSRVWGALGFLPSPQFHLTSPAGVLHNLWTAAKDAAAMANVLPRADTGAWWVLHVDFIALALALAAAVLGAAAAARRDSASRQLIVAAAILSMLGTVSAYAIGAWPTLASLGRWFPNLYFFGGLLAAYALAAGWRGRPAWARFAAAAYAALFATAGALADPGAWLGPPRPSRPYEAEALAAYLEGQGLTYGYGPYWGAKSLIIGPVSGGRVTIRPVAFEGGKLRRRVAESSSLWYRAADEPPGLKARFVLVKNDGEACLDLPACEAAAVRQLGPPARRLEHEGYVVLVFDHPIAERIAE
ncbi:hypothetical protein [Phenylobacterium sp.]|uniref:hypothetical protein n=1 Tax=Phenylobacterium sp. TaxID=1871053 RepID=UPI00262107C8|nr:hypothetical protein [Phenylobacterium sp.]